MATMKDVAKAANVSIATVSNIINGKFTTRNDTYFRVQKAIQDLNYHPNFSARNLKMNKTRLVGVIVPRLNGFYSDIYDGIVSALKDFNMYPILKMHSESGIIEEQIIDEFLDVGVAGIITVSAGGGEIADKYKQVLYQQVSLVLVERDIENLICDKIFFDNISPIEDALRDMPVSDENLVLVRTKENYSTEEEIEEYFLKNHPKSSVIRVKSKCDYMFGELIKLINADWNSDKKIIATSTDIAEGVFDACSVMDFSNEIYALSGSHWKVCEDSSRIHHLERNGYESGFMAAERIRTSLDSDEFYPDALITIDPVSVPGKIGLDKARFDNTKTVRVLALDCDTVNALEALSANMPKRIGCRFEFDKKNYRELHMETLNSIEGKDEYDIIMIDKPWMQLCFDEGLFLRLANDFEKELLGSYPRFIIKDMFENRFRPYCIPLIAGVQAIYYRSDLFRNKEIRDEYWKRYEVEMEKPDNWTNFNRMASFFTDFEVQDTRFKYGTMIGSADLIGLVCEFLPRQWAFNGSILDSKGHPALDSPANIRAVESLVETYKYTDPNQLGNVRDEEIFASLLAGEIPMAVGFSNHYHPERWEDDRYSKLIETLPLPRNRAMVGGYLLGINRTTTKEAACKEFLRLIMSDYGSICISRMQGFVPTNAVYINDYLARDNNWMGLIELVSANRCTREVIRTHRGNYVQNRELDTLLGDTIRKAFKGEYIPEILEETNHVLKEIIYSR